MTVITILCKLSFHYFINTTHPLTHTPSHLHTLTHHTGQKKKLSMIFGVTIPCCLSIFSVILFLRLGFVLGQVSPSLPHHLLSLNLLSLERSENETNPPLHIFPHSWPHTHTHTYTPSHFFHHTHTHTHPHISPTTHTRHTSLPQAGYWQTLVMIVVGYSVVVLTVLSISAIATSATVEGGGVYCILIRLNHVIMSTPGGN